MCTVSAERIEKQKETERDEIVYMHNAQSDT